MRISCPTCGDTIPARNVQLDSQMATCGGCGSVFQFQARSQPAVETPRGFAVRDEGDRLVIIKREALWSSLLMVLFAAAWNGLVWWMMIVPALREGGFSSWGEGVALTFFGLAGAWGFYYGLTLVFNTATITVSADKLSVHHGPLPFVYGNRRLDPASVAQVFCREKVHWMVKNPPAYSYEVHAILNDGERRKLLADLDRPEHGLFIEQELKRGLGMEDRAPANEPARSGSD